MLVPLILLIKEVVRFPRIFLCIAYFFRLGAIYFPLHIPFPLEKDMSALLERMENCREIDDYDHDIVAAIKKINEHHQRRAFFLGFSQLPAEFFSALIASQDRDLKVVAGDAICDVEKESRSGFFNQPWYHSGIISTGQ